MTKPKLNKKWAILCTVIAIVFLTIGNRTHDGVTHVKNSIALGIAAATGKVDVYQKGEVDKLVVQQSQLMANDAAKVATSDAKLKVLYSQSMHYNPTTGIVESSFTR